MPESRDLRRRRLLYRSLYTGCKETDLLLGGFARRFLGEFGDDQLDRYELLLAEPDPDVLDWASGRCAVPPAHDHDVMRLLQNFRYTS